MLTVACLRGRLTSQVRGPTLINAQSGCPCHGRPRGSSCSEPTPAVAEFFLTASRKHQGSSNRTNASPSRADLSFWPEVQTCPIALSRNKGLANLQTDRLPLHREISFGEAHSCRSHHCLPVLLASSCFDNHFPGGDLDNPDIMASRGTARRALEQKTSRAPPSLLLGLEALPASGFIENVLLQKGGPRLMLVRSRHPEFCQSCSQLKRVWLLPPQLRLPIVLPVRLLNSKYPLVVSTWNDLAPFGNLTYGTPARLAEIHSSFSLSFPSSQASEAREFWFLMPDR